MARSGRTLPRTFFARDPDASASGVRRGRVLSRAFFARDADQVARALLGQLLVHETEERRLACRIVETEAYFGPAGRNPHLAQRDDMPARLRAALLRHGDPASHSFVGITDRNRIMYGPPGYWYVYLIYGMHECVNVTTGPADHPEPQAVLLRAGEPVEGVGEMIARRGLGPEAAVTDIASGPAKLAKAMGITRSHYGLDAAAPTSALRLEEGEPARRVATSPRVGVVGGEGLALRYLDADSPHVSKRPKAAKARNGTKAASASGASKPPTGVGASRGGRRP